MSMLRKTSGAYAPSTTKLLRGICLRLTANESFSILEYFSTLAVHCSQRFLFAQVCSHNVYLVELSCPAVMFDHPFKHPATTLFCCTVLNGLNFYTALSCLHVKVYVYHHCHQNHCFQFHLPLQYGPHLCLLLLPLLLAIIVLLY